MGQKVVISHIVLPILGKTIWEFYLRDPDFQKVDSFLEWVYLWLWMDLGKTIWEGVLSPSSTYQYWKVLVGPTRRARARTYLYWLRARARVRIIYKLLRFADFLKRGPG